MREQIELQLTGGPLDEVSEAALHKSPIRDIVRHLGRIEADPDTGLSGREQILRRMRNTDVLLLLHGTEPICAEYIPSKLYEYLWMQRPILATVYGNPQMSELIGCAGQRAVEAVPDAPASWDLAESVRELFVRWSEFTLSDNGFQVLTPPVQLLQQ